VGKKIMERIVKQSRRIARPAVEMLGFMSDSLTIGLRVDGVLF